MLGVECLSQDHSAYPRKILERHRSQELYSVTPKLCHYILSEGPPALPYKKLVEGKTLFQFMFDDRF